MRPAFLLFSLARAWLVPDVMPSHSLGFRHIEPCHSYGRVTRTAPISA